MVVQCVSIMDILCILFMSSRRNDPRRRRCLYSGMDFAVSSPVFLTVIWRPYASVMSRSDSFSRPRCVSTQLCCAMFGALGAKLMVGNILFTPASFPGYVCFPMSLLERYEGYARDLCSSVTYSGVEACAWCLEPPGLNTVRKRTQRVHCSRYLVNRWLPTVVVVCHADCYRRLSRSPHPRSQRSWKRRFRRKQHPPPNPQQQPKQVSSREHTTRDVDRSDICSELRSIYRGLRSDGCSFSHVPTLFL